MPAKRAAKRYNELELSTLDSVFISSNGMPERGVLARTAKLLKIEEKQVRQKCSASVSKFAYV